MFVTLCIFHFLMFFFFFSIFLLMFHFFIFAFFIFNVRFSFFMFFMLPILQKNDVLHLVLCLFVFGGKLFPILLGALLHFVMGNMAGWRVVDISTAVIHVYIFTNTYTYVHIYIYIYIYIYSVRHSCANASQTLKA